ncbi:thioredoxin [Paenibacillus agricola]|uniref:Thioredoxin n=1 Tax=Paenibacillus agricola TaxID=2716264 RepID=A0ABX0JD41_9BACL|nr:thioredoxin [Paenibacillus agricola]NHN33310.1 thioredoxin [Paenibacillus agricola]
MVIEITDQTFQETTRGEGLVIVEFWAPWCSLCKLLEPILEELSSEYDSQVSIAKINVESNQEVSERLGVKSLPALFIYKQGALVGQVNGFVPKSTLQEAIKPFIE